MLAKPSILSPSGRMGRTFRIVGGPFGALRAALGGHCAPRWETLGAQGGAWGGPWAPLGAIWALGGESMDFGYPNFRHFGDFGTPEMW